MKLLLGLLVLAVVAFFVRKAVTKKNAPVTQPSSGNTGSGQAGSGSGFGSEFNGSSQSGTKPVSSGSGSGSGSGNGIGSGGSSDGIINPGGPTNGSGSGSGSKGHKGAGLLDVDADGNPLVDGIPVSDQIKNQIK